MTSGKPNINAASGGQAGLQWHLPPACSCACLMSENWGVPAWSGTYAGSASHLKGCLAVLASAVQGHPVLTVVLTDLQDPPAQNKTIPQSKPSLLVQPVGPAKTA